MSDDPLKPSFAEKPVFEVDDDNNKKSFSLPSRKWLLLLLPVVILVALFLLLRGGGSDEPAPEPTKPVDNNKADIERTVEEFYLRANTGETTACDLFAEPVFASAVAVPTTPESTTPTVPEGTTPEGTTPTVPEGTTPATPTTPEGTTTPTAPEGTTDESSCARWLQETWTSPLQIKKINKITEETDQALITYDLSNNQLGGAILVEENDIWLLATLVGLRGKDLSDLELSEELVSEYELFGKQPLYSAPLPEEPSETNPLPKPKKPSKPAQKTTQNLSCPGGKEFDLVSDIRDENSLQLYPNQGSASGGDIAAASHSLGNRACLAIQWNGDYRQVQGLSIELSYNSWQGSSPSTMKFVPASQTFSIEKNGRSTTVQGSALSSSNGRKLRLLFPAPSDWRNSKWSFWFLRSSFSDGRGSFLFDEGRPAGQTPPNNATNLEGGWPR